MNVALDVDRSMYSAGSVFVTRSITGHSTRLSPSPWSLKLLSMSGRGQISTLGHQWACQCPNAPPPSQATPLNCCWLLAVTHLWRKDSNNDIHHGCVLTDMLSLLNSMHDESKPNALVVCFKSYILKNLYLQIISY